MNKAKELELEREHILSGQKGGEPITDDLIKEYVRRGAPVNYMKQLRDQGFLYFRKTDSFFIPVPDSEYKAFFGKGKNEKRG